MKATLIKLLKSTWQEEKTFAGNLTERDRSARGTLENWSAKDILAHTTAWKAIMAARLEAYLRDEDAPLYREFDEKNAQIYAEHRDQSWATVLENLDSANKRLIEHTETLSEDDLRESERFPWLEDRPLWWRIANNSYLHPLWHIADFLAKRDDPARGHQIMEDMTHNLIALEDTPNWRGNSLYNLACYYALVGETEKALENLQVALSLRPDLVAWSKEDPDLASLWDNPAYQNLVQGDGT